MINFQERQFQPGELVHVVASVGSWMRFEDVWAAACEISVSEVMIYLADYRSNRAGTLAVVIYRSTVVMVLKKMLRALS